MLVIASMLEDIPSGCISVLFWALAEPEYDEGMLIRRAMLRHSKLRNF